MAAIFSFMKTMDPSSVVRESEFDAAAASAGKLSQRWNIHNRIKKGKILTNKQKEDFEQILTAFMDKKTIWYNREYEEMSNAMNQFGIDESLYPINASKLLEEYGGSVKDPDIGKSTQRQAPQGQQPWIPSFNSRR